MWAVGMILCPLLEIFEGAIVGTHMTTIREKFSGSLQELPLRGVSSML